MKKSFTLIEVLLAISILSIMVLATANVISSLKFSNKTLLNAYKNSEKNELLIKTIYADILNSDGNITIVKSENKKFTRLFLHTKNTLYNNIYPYVMWYVSKNKNTLVRMECHHKITLHPDSKECIVDIFAKGVGKFEIYRKKINYLIYIKAGEKNIFEMYEGIDEDKNETNKTKGK